LIIVVVGHYLVGDTLVDRGDISPIKWAGPIEALSTFPVVVFAYTCHQNVSNRQVMISGRAEADSWPDVFHRE
jgi:amino acid permease